MMIVSIHQPNIFPWLGFFNKMAQSDVFILLDNVPFSKGGLTNRVRLKGSNGLFWLTTPIIIKGRMGQVINDIEINNLTSWKETHRASLMSSYNKTPGYDIYMPELMKLYDGNHSGLVDFTIPGIILLRDILQIKTPIIRSSELNCTGSRSTLLCDLVKVVGGTTYLSGPSGRNYLDEGIFDSQEIKIEYSSFHVFEYPQRFNNFIGGLSALDYIFNDPDLSLLKNR